MFFTRRDRMVLQRILFLVKGVPQMAVDLSKLTQAVTDQETVEDSVLALVTGMAEQIAALSEATPTTSSSARLATLRRLTPWSAG